MKHKENCLKNEKKQRMPMMPKMETSFQANLLDHPRPQAIDCQALLQEDGIHAVNRAVLGKHLYHWLEEEELVHSFLMETDQI